MEEFLEVVSASVTQLTWSVPLQTLIRKSESQRRWIASEHEIRIFVTNKWLGENSDMPVARGESTKGSYEQNIHFTFIILSQIMRYIS
jgi:hypothetical protein